MTGYIKHPRMVGHMPCGKSHLILELMRKGHNKYFDYIIIIYLLIRWNKIYYITGRIRDDDNGRIIELKGELCQWVEKLALNITDKRLGKPISIKICYLR